MPHSQMFSMTSSALSLATDGRLLQATSDLVGGCLPSPLCDDRAPAPAAIRVRTLVAVGIRPSAGTVVMARRRSPVTVPAPVADSSGAAAPLELLLNVVPLIVAEAPYRPYPSSFPTGFIILLWRLSPKGLPAIEPVQGESPREDTAPSRERAKVRARG